MADRPVAMITAPLSGAQYAPGERITVRVAAAATHGVAQVELRRDAALIGAYSNPTLSPAFTAQFAMTMTHTGPVALQAIAYDTSGAASTPASVAFDIVEQVTLLPTITASAQSVGGSCVSDVEFVSDITVPDNTPIDPGAPFVKTWRVRNSGLCAWVRGYELVYIQGSQMNAPNRVPVATAEPGAAVDISVTFVSPRDSGVYTSTWQMRSAHGLLFGKRLFTVIRVP